MAAFYTESLEPAYEALGGGTGIIPGEIQDKYRVVVAILGDIIKRDLALRAVVLVQGSSVHLGEE